MEILLGLLLSLVPMGTYIYDVSQQGMDKEFRLEMTHHYEYYFKTDSSALPLPTLKKEGSYKSLKSSILSKQTKLQSAYKSARNEAAKNQIIKEAGIYVTDQLVNSLFPHWYGTTWSFDGYTAVPNSGEVGCSYFVSTTLLHAGFNINRYRLAQQGPVSEAKSLVLEGELISVEVGLDFNEFIPTIQKECEEGLYFIGLGHSHVGYIYYRESEVYFIQSSYGKDMSVVIDYANESDILTGFGNFTLVPITTNKPLIKRWLTGDAIEVLKGTD